MAVFVRLTRHLRGSLCNRIPRITFSSWVSGRRISPSPCFPCFCLLQPRCSREPESLFAEWAVGERRREGGMERKGDQGGVEEELSNRIKGEQRNWRALKILLT